MDYHYSDPYDRDEALKRQQPESNGTLATRIAELTRQLSTLQRDFDLMKADRDRLLDELAKRWPDNSRKNMSYVESKRAQFEVMADDLADIIDDIIDERDALAAQVEQLHKLHCDLTNADMVFEEDCHTGYLITHDQLEEMEFIFREPAQYLAERDASKFNDGYNHCLRAIKQERDALKAQVEQLREQLEYMAQQHRCGCGHPACNRCYDDKQNAIVLEATPAQCLAEVKAQAGRDGFIAGADSYFDRHSDEEMSEHVLNSADQYANQIRQQAAKVE